MRKRKLLSRQKRFLIFTLLGISAFGALYSFFFFENKTAKSDVAKASLSKERYIIYPAQYSDTHITVNAIEGDPRFKNLSIFPREDLVANVAQSIKLNRVTKNSGQAEKGTWLWTPVLDITPKYRNSIITGAKKHGIRNIYISIDSYLDIFVMEDGPEKDRKKKMFDDILEDFITEAHKNNITVDAEGGWRNWAEEGHIYKAFAVVDYAIEFNKTHKEKLRGFQYDVEPYLLSYYQKDKMSVLRNFVTLINETVSRLHESDLALSVVIPEFSDGTGGETPQFKYAGKTAYAIDHLLSVLERRPSSNIIIMSYRNFSLGDDGSVDISKHEVTSAKKYNTKIIIAQEIGEVNPPYVTFHNTSKSYYEKQMQTIQKTFAKEKSYGGVAIHYINALLELK